MRNCSGLLIPVIVDKSEHEVWQQTSDIILRNLIYRFLVFVLHSRFSRRETKMRLKHKGSTSAIELLVPFDHV